MKCPYCVSELKSQALVCHQCKRDIALPKQLMSRINALEEQLYALQTKQHNLSESARIACQAQAPATNQNSKNKYQNIFFDFTKFFLLPLFLLMLAHFFITVVYDTKILYLRLVTLVLPMCFGYFLFRNQTRNPFVWVIAVVILGWISVAGMSVATSYVDESPLWPQTIYIWRDLIEFAASISFSYMTGMLLGRRSFLKSINITTSSTAAHPASSGWLSDKNEERLPSVSLEIVAKKINEFTATIGAIVTTIVAIYTGLKGLF